MEWWVDLDIINRITPISSINSIRRIKRYTMQAIEMFFRCYIGHDMVTVACKFSYYGMFPGFDSRAFPLLIMYICAFISSLTFSKTHK